MSCCGRGNITRAKVGQVEPVLPSFDGDTVELIYQLPGVALPYSGPVTNRRYKISQNAAVTVDARDAAVMLQRYDKLRRVAVFTVAKEEAAAKTEQSTEQGTTEEKPAKAAAPRRRRRKKSQSEE